MATGTEDFSAGDQPRLERPSDIFGAGSSAQEALLEACPALGLAEDRESHYLLATEFHRCYAGARPRSIPPEYQVRLCLAPAHTRCPLYIASQAAGAGAN